MTEYVFWPLLAVFLYPALQAALMRLSRGSRDTLADIGRKLLQDPSVSEEHKVFVSDIVDDVFDWRFMAFATVTFPKLAFSGNVRNEITPNDRAFFSRDDVSEMMDAHMKAVMAVSPIFTLSFLIVAMVTVVLLIAFVGFSVLALIWGDTVKHVSPNVGHQRTEIVAR